jgi:hypothetical protein
MQRQMRRLTNPFPDEGAMRLKHRLAVAAHLAGRNRTGRAMTLRPLHHRRYRNAKPQCYRATTITLRNRSDNALPQIIGKWSDHQMLASSPASILNHIRPISGIPPDSIKP